MSGFFATVENVLRGTKEGEEFLAEHQIARALYLPVAAICILAHVLFELFKSIAKFALALSAILFSIYLLVNFIRWCWQH